MKNRSEIEAFYNTIVRETGIKAIDNITANNNQTIQLNEFITKEEEK